jgi:hypothetical protein
VGVAEAGGEDGSLVGDALRIGDAESDGTEVAGFAVLAAVHADNAMAAIVISRFMKTSSARRMLLRA